MKWILGVCVVVVVAGVAATMTMPAQTITPDEATLRLFAPELQAVAAVDAAGLRNSSLIQEMLQKQPFPRDAQDFFEATGFQPLRDVGKVTVGVAPKNGVLAIVDASYDHFKVEQYLRDRNAYTENYSGRALYSPDSRQMQSLAFIDRTILAGNTEMVKQAIDRMGAPAPNALQNAALLEMIRKIEAGNQIWVVGQTGVNVASSLPVPTPPELQDVLKSLTAGSYQMRITQDVHITAIGSFSNAESARTSADLLRGLVALARTQTAREPDVLHLFDGVRIDNSGALMTIHIDAPGDLLKSLQPRKLAELAR